MDSVSLLTGRMGRGCQRAALTALVASVVAAGCGVRASSDATQITEEKSALYLLGSTWPSGRVPVCYDPNDGNNPALLAMARKLVTDSWARAANVYATGWGPCNYVASAAPSIVAIHFAAGSTGVTDRLGPQPSTPQLPSTCLKYGLPGCVRPGVTNVTWLSNDTGSFQQFRYEVIHEFGHVLGFAHEQERPDNWTAAGTFVYCDLTQSGRKALPGGTYETPSYDVNSIMSYCAHDPFNFLNPTTLSSGDIAGVRRVYGRNFALHGFMILSDRNTGLAVNAFGGAAEGTVLRLHSACNIDNPDCTFTYQRGMLLSDTDPTLAVKAQGGAANGHVLILTAACSPTDPQCTWTYKKGEFLSDQDSTLAINALGGAAFGTTLGLAAACTPANPDCTWTMPTVLLSSAVDSTFALNAMNGATNGGALTMADACVVSNPDCVWTFSKGVIMSGRDGSLAINAWGGAAQGTTIRLTNLCTLGNTDCTWSWSHGQIVSDRVGVTLPIRTVGGPSFGGLLQLDSSCTARTAQCVYSGNFAQDGDN